MNSKRPKRVCLTQRDAAIAHEAIWQLEGTDAAWDTNEVRRLMERLDRVGRRLDWRKVPRA